ncbi:hypothetical protein ENSA5_04930 [Enhygromyxa salina]|uniref:Uncharacterized protein n=1 Tax=Enhygromyxa salina TaxID=215803 RepID=A0A2S9YHZ2_9BACT|nr:hypothetical protein [Enhygromyxa salina]PRQ04728.1 hypothetical protein ENSA5_04930 [Enhygromyxa salina]
MRLGEAIALARRYRSDARPQAAWSIDNVPTAIHALTQRGSATVAVALVLDDDGALTEAMPTVRASHFRVFERSISRELGESWPVFVERCGREAKELPAELLAEFHSAAAELALPDEHRLWYRLTWNSELEWHQNFGLNLIELRDGEPADPTIGHDAEGIHYFFRHAHTDPKLGRHLFDLAEQLCAELDRVRGPLIGFVRAKLETAHDPSSPELEAFMLRAVGERDFEVYAYLRDAASDPDGLARGYWEVRLAEDFAPAAFGGVVSAIPR